MIRAWTWAVGALVMIGSPATSAHAGGGRLDTVRSQVRPAPSPPRRTSASHSRQPPSTRGTRVYTRSAPRPTTHSSRTVVTTYVVTRRAPAPAAVPPPQALRPHDESLELEQPPPRAPFQRLVNRWPYESRRAGWVAEPSEANARDHRRVAGRAAVEGSYLFGDLVRSGVSARVGSPRLDVDTQMSFYFEPTRPDALYLGDTSINFAPVALPGIVWRFGVGARYMADARLPGSGPREYAAGWNATTSIDVFPGKPFVISARLDRGSLYETPVWRARATVGIVHRRFELFAGYDHTQVQRVSLGGPLLGLRAWL